MARNQLFSLSLLAPPPPVISDRSVKKPAFPKRRGFFYRVYLVSWKRRGSERRGKTEERKKKKKKKSHPPPPPPSPSSASPRRETVRGGGKPDPDGAPASSPPGTGWEGWENRTPPTHPPTFTAPRPLTSPCPRGTAALPARRGASALAAAAVVPEGRSLRAPGPRCSAGTGMLSPPGDRWRRARRRQG